MNGYAGKMLIVNLTNGTFEEEVFDETYARTYIGGYGFGAEVMLRRMPAYADPLGPDNLLGFVAGPANATPALFGGRYMSVCKSPLSNGWSDAGGGGTLGPTMKRAGYDGVFFTGISETPVYLVIDDGKYELKDASHLWGKNSRETTALLKEEYGKNASVAAIGKAGEEMLRLACIMNDDMSAAARGGHGAVMGSKKLKALVLKGSRKIALGEPEKLKQWSKGIADCIANPPPQRGIIHAFKRYGTGSMTKMFLLSGDASVKHFTGSILDMKQDEIDVFGTDQMEKDWYVKSEGCAQCPMQCKSKLNVQNSKWPLGDACRPQYDSYVAFGSNCWNSDLDAVQICNEYCNRAGLDTMSTGAVVSWVMDCYENGALTKEDLDGIEATWKTPEVIVELTRKIAQAEGVGRILGNGQDYAAKHFQKGDDYKTTIGGVEAGLHDHRNSVQLGYARIYQYDPAPGRHTKGGILNCDWNADDRGEQDLEVHAKSTYDNCAGFCMFIGFTGMDYYAALNHILGEEITHEEWLNTAKRIFILRQAFNLREGINAHIDHKLPKKLTRVFQEGPNTGI